MRLDTSDHSSLKKAVSAVYDPDLRQELEEEKQINDFLQIVESLVEDGYDLSEYTYDELYESYLEEGLGAALGAALKFGGRIAAPILRGAKGPTKQLLTKLGQAVVPTALLGGLDQYLTGGKVRDWTGAALQGVRQAAHSIPTPEQAKDILDPYLKEPPKLPKPSAAKPEPSLKILNGKIVGYNHFDPFDIVKGHLISEGYADTEEAALVIMANMSEEWRVSILDEAASDQSDKQIEKGVKTTYKAGNVIDNQHQGRSRGLDRLPSGERAAKTKRMRARLKARRDDLFKERNKREDDKMSELKKRLGL